jgi:DNA-binding LacI/PurR family transcriptional regulator
MEADNIRQNKSHYLALSLHFITGVTTACEEHDYSLHLVTQSLDENSLLDFYRTNQSDGVILMAIRMDDWSVKLLVGVAVATQGFAPKVVTGNA